MRGVFVADPSVRGVYHRYEFVGRSITRLSISRRPMSGLNLDRGLGPSHGKPRAPPLIRWSGLRADTAAFPEGNSRAIANRRHAQALLQISQSYLCFNWPDPASNPPLGFFFDLRSLNLMLGFAEAFFFREAMFFLGCGVLG